MKAGREAAVSASWENAAEVAATGVGRRRAPRPAVAVERRPDRANVGAKVRAEARAEFRAEVQAGDARAAGRSRVSALVQVLVRGLVRGLTQVASLLRGSARRMRVVAGGLWTAGRARLLRPTGTGRAIRVVDQAAAGAKLRLVLVEVDGQRVLVAASGDQVPAMLALTAEGKTGAKTGAKTTGSARRAGGEKPTGSARRKPVSLPAGLPAGVSARLAVPWNATAGGEIQ